MKAHNFESENSKKMQVFVDQDTFSRESVEAWGIRIVQAYCVGSLYRRRALHLVMPHEHRWVVLGVWDKFPARFYASIR